MEGWAIVELLGKVAMAGKVSEEKHFGGTLGKIEVPDPSGEGFVTHYFGATSIYRITLVEEDVARAFLNGWLPDFIYNLSICGGWPVYEEELYEDREFDGGDGDDDMPF